MKAALIGLGYWGKTILPIIVSMEKELGIEIAHVCDHHEDNLERCKRNHPSINVHLDADEVLEAGNVDAVFINTGLHTHYPLVRKFLDNGCHVCVEKPYVPTVQQANELNELARSRELALLVGHRLLYAPSIQWLKANVFGERVPAGVVVEAAWKNWGIHQTGGAHWDLATHYIAALNYLTGSVPEVIAVTPLCMSATNNVEDVSVVLRYPGQLVARVDVSWNSPYKVKEMVVKTRDRLVYIDHEAYYPLIAYDAKAVSTHDGDKERYRVSKNEQRRYTKEEMNERSTIEGQFKDFVQAARTGKAVLASGEHATGVVETLCRIDQVLKEISP